MTNEKIAQILLKHLHGADDDLQEIARLTGIPISVLQSVKDSNEQAADLIGVEMGIPSKTKIQDVQTGYNPSEFGVSEWDRETWKN